MVRQVFSVLDEFTEYYKKVVEPYNAVADETMALQVDQLLETSRLQVHEVTSNVTAEDVAKCIGNLKHHKAVYLDSISSEHLIFGGPQLVVHLALLFNSMIYHSFVPSDFCNGVIIPLLKSKHGDATDINMYRGITLSPAISKLFESALLCLYDEFITSDPLQFGFKKKSSCTHVLFTVNESIKYITKEDQKYTALC